MSEEIKVITSVDEITTAEWSDLVQSSSVASWFQTREAFEFFDGPSFLDAFCVAVKNNGLLKGLVVGYIQKDGGKLKQFFSRRAIINGGPLLADDITEQELGALLSAVKVFLKRKAIYIETRNFNDYGRWRVKFEKCGFDYEPHLNFHVDTTSIDTINQNMTKNRKRDIRVSFRDGAKIIENPTKKQIEDFYIILSDLYNNKIKTPLYPLSFFEELNKQSTAIILLVEYNEKIIGGTVCVVLKDTTVYEWFVCGMDDIDVKTIFPSEVATYAGLKYSTENGCKVFDMMGAGVPDVHYGVRDFKAKFGGQLVEYGRFRYVCNPFLFKLGTFGVKILKKL